MLEMVKGCYVPKNELLSEQYQITDFGYIANVNAGKIKEVFNHFITMQDERMFFILELPTNQNDEKNLGKTDTDLFHKDVYYIDGLNIEQALIVLKNYGELLINDGISKFGFGVHDNSAELMLDNYNVITLWTSNIDKYLNFFEKMNIFSTDNFMTAWNTFSQDSPGKCMRIDLNGKSVYDLPDELAGWGLYLAERNEV